MAISNEATYYELLASPFQRCRISKNSLTTVAGRSYSTWLMAAGYPAAGAAPTTAAVPTSATAGAWSSPNADLFDGAGTRRLLKAVIDHAPTASPGGMLTICDRLSHQGGLSGTTTGAQTTNLGTAALTRKTSGVGVLIGLEIYSAIGATGTTVTCSYTDSTPTAAQVPTTVTWGGTGFNAASRVVILPGVTTATGPGVTAVASVTNTATTGTAGNFGVTLFYPMVHVPLDDILCLKGYADALYGFGCWFPKVEAGACLFGIVHTAGALTGVLQADFLIAEDR